MVTFRTIEVPHFTVPFQNIQHTLAQVQVNPMGMKNQEQLP